MKRSSPSLSLRAAVQLAAPHTWPAAVMPVLLGFCASCLYGPPADIPAALAVLLTAVLLQSSVNTLNDYFDFLSGLDSADNCPDRGDAALLYENARPSSALGLGLLFMAAAAVPGLWLCLRCGWDLLWYALGGLLAILLYTLPQLHFFRLPLGELLSGLAMGGGLCWVSFRVQLGRLSPLALMVSIPCIISVGCIMLANNCCDIEKDLRAGKRTFPNRAGRENAQMALRGLELLSLFVMLACSLLFFPRALGALSVLPVWLLLTGSVRELFLQPADMPHRPACMKGVLDFLVRSETCFCAGLCLSAFFPG